MDQRRLDFAGQVIFDACECQFARFEALARSDEQPRGDLVQDHKLRGSVAVSD